VDLRGDTINVDIDIINLHDGGTTTVKFHLAAGQHYHVSATGIIIHNDHAGTDMRRVGLQRGGPTNNRDHDHYVGQPYDYDGYEAPVKYDLATYPERSTYRRGIDADRR
jgi:hypothetical protein